MVGAAAVLQPQVEQDHRTSPRRQAQLREGRGVVALAAVPHATVALDVAAQPKGGGAERLVHVDQRHHYHQPGRRRVAAPAHYSGVESKGVFHVRVPAARRRARQRHHGGVGVELQRAVEQQQLHHT